MINSIKKIKDKIILDNFKTINDVFSFYSFKEEYYDYDYQLFKYSLDFITLNVLIPKDTNVIKIEDDNFGYQYRIFYNVYINNNDHSYSYLSTETAANANILAANKSLNLLLSDNYIYKVSDIPKIIEKMYSANIFIKYQLELDLKILEEKQLSISKNITDIKKLLAKSI